MQETHTLEKKDWAAKLMAIAVVVFMVSSTLVLFTPDASARTGSDDYGYTFKDSNEADGPTYSWIEIIPALGGSGTTLLSSSTDGGQGQFDLPFSFDFYENTYTTWGNGGDNGYVTLGAVVSNQWTSYHIPANQLGVALVGGWFDGGFCRSSNPNAGVYYDTLGTEPNRQFVVTYQDQGAWYPSVYQCPGAAAANALTWQIIIHEGSGEITMQYKDTDGGYSSDNEWLTAGVQGKPGGTLTGLEYVYRRSPSAIQPNTAVLYAPPPPLRNDIRLTSSLIPDPVSLATDNVFGAEVTNYGVNCDTAGSCDPIAETTVDVSASVFEVQETTTSYDFDGGDGGGFTSGSYQGTDSWTTNANDGVGNYNYGDEGAPDDGAWSSGRKSLSLGGMFSDSEKIHYDGTDILVANRAANEVIKISTSTHAKSTVLGPDTTYLRNVLDVTEDGSHYYTLSRLANLNSYTTYICKWSMADGSRTACNYSSVQYGIAIAHYDGEVFALQGGWTSTASRKVVILSASNLANTGKTVPYYSGVSAYSYASNMDVDQETGDVYIVYREFNGRVRGYDRSDSGTYCASSSCYTQVYTYARYSSSVTVYDGWVYTNGYYYSSYYGGMKKFPTGGGSVTTLWSSFGTTGYRGSMAVTSDGDIYVNSNYAYRYYNFQNWDDSLWVHEGGTSGTPDVTLGPMPAMLSHLSTPSYDLSSAIGATMEFKLSWQFYYRYEGAYMEASTDGGSSWSYINNDHFTSGKYYGTVFVWYNTPISTSIDTWTYYNTNNAYTYMTHSAPWKTFKMNLDDYTGYSDVKFRWVVGFNTYNLAYYNSYFRLDDVDVTIKAAGTTYASETQTIDSLGFKESATVNFFETNKFRPSLEGLSVGDKLGVLINVADNGGDQDMSNNRAVAFREVKFVIFSDNFDDGDMSTSNGDWSTGKIKYGSPDWAPRTKDSTSGSYSMDSGYRTEGALPGDPYVSTPDLDLKLPVEAELQMMISFYAYYLYDGYQMQISEDSGSSWNMITPTSTCGDNGGYPNIIYNYAYYANPLRGQPGYTYYGTDNTMYSYSPDPQNWCKATFDLNPYTGQSDIRFRVVAGWSTIPTSLSLYESFFRFDDIAVTGLVYNDNVGVSGLDLPDPIAINAVVPVGTTVINAGINAQAANAAKLRLQIGPLGIQTLDASDDMEGYANQAAAESAGWSTNTECSDYAYSCGNWGAYGGDPGFVFNTDDGDGDETNSWGPDGAEFQMYYGGGVAEVETGALDFTGAPGDMVLKMKHRYNWDYYGGYPSYNGGQVQISTDEGLTWELFTPVTGYTGTMYNYVYYGNPLYNQPGFVHCGSCPGDKSAGGDADEYITTEFNMADYVDMTDVRLKFVVGMYNYQWPSDGEHWYIDSLTFTGTGMESVAFEETVAITGSGTGGIFESGEAVDKVWNYHFQVPGAYKIVFDTWIGTTPSDGDDFLGDNQVTAARETMFTVAGTTADESALSKKNDELGQMFYDNDWMSIKEGGPKDGYQWQPSASSASEMSHSPVWWAGNDAYGSAYDGDDTSLTSPAIDLSKATSAKLVFNHRFAFYGVEYPTYYYYYDGGRVEISTDGGDSWAGLPVTSGEMYRGDIYNYAYYGNPLSGEIAFAMSSSGGANFVESQCRLDDYVGAGFDNLKIRFHFGGAFPNWGSSWEIDDVGIYALGFDLAQTSASTPYTLEIGESAQITTSFINQGVGSLGAGGAVESASAKAYVNDMSGNELWSASSALGDLNMAYYDEMGNTFPGQATAEIAFTFPGMDTAGMYTVGVKVADSTGATLADLFSANNDASHMLLVGMSADLGSPTLTGGENWAAVEGEPSDVGDGAMGVDWDETGVATDTLSVSIVGQAGGFSPSAPEAQVGTTVTWTNADTMTHTITDDNAQFDSFDIAAGESWSLTFTEIGVFNYYCKYHPMMEGSITIVSDASADEQVRTNYLQVWTAESYLVFWANFDMSDDSSISVIAQKKGSSLNDADSIGLWAANGFTIMDGSDHSEVGDSLTRSSGWNPYYIYLDSSRLGYNGLDYDPSDDNAYAFVFRARGLDGSAEIGGVQLIRTLDTGFFLTKDDPGQLTYEIFPSLAVEIDYFAKNIGTESNTFRMTPELDAQGNVYDGAAFDISINVRMNGETFDSITTSSNDDGTWTHAFDMAPDDEAMITVRFGAPDYDQESGEPAGNRKFDVVLSAHDVGSGEDMREPVTATLFIKPSQFALGEMSFDRASVIEGDTLDITVKAWNEGNYASDVLVVFYVMDSSGDAYSTPEGVKRMTRVASTTVDLMAPKPVLEDQGIYMTWYYATGTWEEAFIPGETVKDFDSVSVYAMINPEPEQQDIDAGHTGQDEYLNQKDDNDANGEIAIVKNKASTPSFAVGILGMSIAALVAAVGASLRREEE